MPARISFSLRRDAYQASLIELALGEIFEGVVAKMPESERKRVEDVFRTSIASMEESAWERAMGEDL
jgi:hypothetical protein